MDSAHNLAENIRQLRDSRGLTQLQCAKASGIPRATWANLESGSANPTLAVLVRVAAALQVSVEELIASPKASCQFFKSGALSRRKLKGGSVSQLLPESIVGMQFERIELEPGASMTGVPHTAGTREYLACEKGQVQLAAAGEKWKLSAGDVVVFRGDQRHVYTNPTRSRCVAYSVIALSAVSRDVTG